jgi:hypothetical protein
MTVIDGGNGIGNCTSNSGNGMRSLQRREHGQAYCALLDGLSGRFWLS